MAEIDKAPASAAAPQPPVQPTATVMQPAVAPSAPAKPRASRRAPTAQTGSKAASSVKPTASGKGRLSPTQDRQLRQILADCRRLLSERGEANGPSIAAGIVGQLDTMSDDLRGRFFEQLARDFSPDPKKVLAAALAYAQAPGNTEHLIRLTETAEPPRQELFRRLNRAPGGTAARIGGSRSAWTTTARASQSRSR